MAELEAAVVWRHLECKKPISAIAEELSIQPTSIHRMLWLLNKPSGSAWFARSVMRVRHGVCEMPEFDE